MKIVGHRGAAGLAPENSLESIRVALTFNLPGIEIDLHPTADGQLVLHHDTRGGRTANFSGKIRNLSSDEIREASARSEHQIPTLEDAINLIAKSSKTSEIILDCKGHGWAEILDRKLAALEKSGFDTSRIIVLSFFGLELRKLRKLNSKVRIYYLFRELPIVHLIACKLLKAEGTGYNQLRIIVPLKVLLWFVNLFRLRLYVYTVDSLDKMQRYQEAGTAYLATDRPDLLK